MLEYCNCKKTCRRRFSITPFFHHSIIPFSSYKLIVIVGFVHIQGRPLLQVQPRFPGKILLRILVQLLRKLPHGDPHRAHPLTRPTVRATPRTMISPQKMKRHRVRRIIALPHPLRPRFIHKTGRAIAQRARVPARVAPQAPGNQLSEKRPLLLRVHPFNALHITERIHPFLLRHRLGYQLIVDHRVAVRANRTVPLQKILLLEALAEPLPPSP